MQTRIYFDNASTTPLNEDVYNTYVKLLHKYYANSESLYNEGVEVNNLLEKARNQIANLLNVDKQEIIFTSGASESNNLAIKGICFNETKNKHLITTEVEHSSVFNTFKQLEELFGFDVTYLKTDKDGKVNVDDLRKAIRPDTLLVSIMMVNNETGAINDIDTIKEIVKTKSSAFLHVDCVQALGKLHIDLKDIDLASFSAHKIEGLKGSGILVKRKHLKLVPLISAGQQEGGLRGGTSNAVVNICFAKTLRLALESIDYNRKIIEPMMNYLVEELSKINQVHINCRGGLYNILNFHTNISSEVMMNALNNKGICVSAQSTCSSKSKSSSRALKALGLTDKEALSSIRISLSSHNTLDEVKYFIECIKEIVIKYDTN